MDFTSKDVALVIFALNSVLLVLREQTLQDDTLVDQHAERLISTTELGELSLLDSHSHVALADVIELSQWDLARGCACKHDPVAFVFVADRVRYVDQPVQVSDCHSEAAVLIGGQLIDIDLRKASNLIKSTIHG